MKIRYIYNYVPVHTATSIVFRKQPVACVASYEGNIGVSIKNPKDKHFSKKRAREIAEGRAMVGHVHDIPNAKIFIKTEGDIVVYKNTVLYPYKRIQLRDAIAYAASKLNG